MNCSCRRLQCFMWRSEGFFDRSCAEWERRRLLPQIVDGSFTWLPERAWNREVFDGAAVCREREGEAERE